MILTKGEAHACRATINRLTTLVDSARDLRGEAKSLGLRDTARSLNDAARTLDGARTRLVEDGPEYLDAARAFINAAENMLTDRAIYIGRFANGRH
ncbi:hypothetical protein [Microbacterium sp. H6]|uniref:hypothetical protein n=1 Tax=Microbacterium sp. H6 TaxID=421122 RepID=UPI000DE37352|nr:hypothetical protein [Microbacterium sp. H6]RBO72775.1 hypothetical protein DSP71_09060 [Microbacterium sp. H6]